MLFRCIRSGNTVNIEQIDDIERMKYHEGYVPVIDYVELKEKDHEIKKTDSNEDADEDAKKEKVLIKKRGRPVKGK